jgi:hypothetical protein
LRFRGFVGREDGTNLYFPLVARTDRLFEMGLEKLEYIVDIVPVQLKSLPAETDEVWYSYDETAAKWYPMHAASGKATYVYKNETWIVRQ